VHSLVLVIDDDPVVREIVDEILQDAEFEVVTAADGREGMRLFRTRQPDLVVTDIIMPEQEGIETITQMRKERPTACILAMSGGGRIGDCDVLDNAQQLGANEILAKPFDANELIATARRCLGGR
jgi:DNA-binding response OmpR family regulator